MDTVFQLLVTAIVAFGGGWLAHQFWVRRTDATRAAKVLNTMELHRLTFTHAALRGLPEPEQLFFSQLAHVRNDLRHLDNMALVASNAVRSTEGICREVALHQLIFTLRLIYGTLSEGWNVIDSVWNGKQLGRTFHTRLTPEAKEALKFLTKYFSDSNLIRVVRNNAAFHYDADGLKAPLAAASPEEVHHFVTGSISGNIFYGFAEKLHVTALVSLTGKSDEREAIRAFYDEAHRTVYPRFTEFTDAVLLEIVKTLDWKSEAIEAPAADPAMVETVIFVDEDAVRASAEASLF